jgi:hypothetical protein
MGRLRGGHGTPRASGLTPPLVPCTAVSGKTTVINFYETSNNFYAGLMNNPFQTVDVGNSAPDWGTRVNVDRARAMTAG